MKLSKKQQLAIDLMASGANVYLTGYAGTGKTTVLKEYIEDAEKSGKNVLVCAQLEWLPIILGTGQVHFIESSESVPGQKSMQNALNIEINC